jgi:hypothetical protein
MDRVFPQFDYGQLLLEDAARQSTPGMISPEAAGAAAQIVRSALHGYVGWALQRSGALGEALKEMDLALAIYADNPSLSKLKLDTLFAVIDAETLYLEAYAGETTRTFYACANRDAGVLVTHGRKLMRVLQLAGERAQLSALIDDWYTYSSLVTTPAPADSLQREIAALEELHDYRECFPESMQSDLGAGPLDSGQSLGDTLDFRDRLREALGRARSA